MHSFLDEKAKHYVLLTDNTCSKHISSMTISTENRLKHQHVNANIYFKFQSSLKPTLEFTRLSV